MRISILACVISAVAAICLYACVAHVLAARHPWFRKVHLTFAALALLAVVHAVAHIGMYVSQDVAQYAQASRLSNLSGAIVMAIIPWLIQGYFGGGSRLAPWFLSGFYLLSGALNEIGALRGWQSPPVLEQIVLPWGEAATVHRLPEASVGLLAFWAVTVLLLGYVAALAVRRRLRGNPAQTLAMLVSLALMLASLLGNTLVLAGKIDFIFMGEFGFLALVLTMMRLLSGEESYRAVIAQASAGILVAAPGGRFLDANRTGCRMLGRSRSELLAMSMWDIAVPESGAPDVDSPIESGRSLRRLRRRDGSILLVDMSTQVLSDGRMLYIARDVTEVQRVNSAIRVLAASGPEADPAQFFERCVRSLAEAFNVHHAFVGVLDERREMMSPAAQWCADGGRIEAYPAAHAPVARLGVDRPSLHLANASAEFPAHQPFREREMRGYLGAAIFDQTGALMGVVEIWDAEPFVAEAESHKIMEMFAHRIGAEMERSASERELRQLTATLEARIAARTSELAQANQELEAFSYSVSHDLRAPVRAIDAHASMLLDSSEGRLAEGARKHLDRILQAARRMAELIDGLLTLARLSHQQQAIVTVDLSAIATQAIELLQERDRAHSVQFACTPGLHARADLTGASIVLTNLLENAWKYSSRSREPRIEFGCESSDGETVFFVRDNGVGFDMQHAKHLFEPFHRLHSPGEFPGSGVGLATVARIVKRHDGRVWAKSAPGQGATFYFTLHPPEDGPLEPAAARAKQIAASP